MLAIRMQRTGRSGHTQFRVIVQDSHFSPTRGRVVSYLGSYDPHTKITTIDSEKASKYLENGAQPSDTVAKLFKKEGIKLPTWVKLNEPQKRQVRNPAKRRSTAPAKPEVPAEPVATETEIVEEAAAEPEAPAEKTEATPEPLAEEAAPAEPATEEPATTEEVTETPAPTEETPAESTEPN